MKKTDYQKSFVERLKIVRAHSGLSQIDFAQRINSSQPTVVRLEAGTRMAEAYLVQMVAEEFGCNIGWLLTGKGSSGLK